MFSNKEFLALKETINRLNYKRKVQHSDTIVDIDFNKDLHLSYILTRRSLNDLNNLKTV